MLVILACPLVLRNGSKQSGVAPLTEKSYRNHALAGVVSCKRVVVVAFCR